MRPCPRCDYDLTGLPDEHICPECGFAYDKHAISIRLSARKEYRKALVFGVIYMLFWVGLRQLGSFAVPVGVLFGFVIVFLVMLLFQFWKYRTVADRMILTREGFMFHSPTGTTPPVPWSEVKSARCSWWDGQLRIDRPNHYEPLTISHRSVGGVRIGKKCADEINRLKELYSQE